jgi:steroid delta-isomerase-like uncharacterized protein
MSVEENKAIDLRFFEEVVNNGELAIMDELFAANFVDHSAAPGIAPDRDGLKQFFAMVHSAFPDFHSTLEDMFAEGDKVVQRFTARGTHKGDWMGIAPTGKQFTMPGMAIHRITDGKIVENWVNMDMLGMMQQLGVIPSPG